MKRGKKYPFRSVNIYLLNTNDNWRRKMNNGGIFMIKLTRSSAIEETKLETYLSQSEVINENLKKFQFHCNIRSGWISDIKQKNYVRN